MDKARLIDQIMTFLASFLGKDETLAVKVDPAPTSEAPTGVDWSTETAKVSKYFTVHECLWLPSWKRMANAADGLDDKAKANLEDLCKAMDAVHEHFGKPVRVHVTYRPLEYNKAIGGALHSAHSDGAAMDFDVIGMTCDEVRKELVDKNLLETWSMRCEDTPGSNWVHLDRRALIAGGHRLFKP